jgi:acetate kinase
MTGAIEGIGQGISTLRIEDSVDTSNTSKQVDTPTHPQAAAVLADYLKQIADRYKITAAGHRIVHGGPKYYTACTVTPTVLADLRQLTAFDPEHLPAEIHLIESLQELFPNITQVVCFDTAFHHDLPREAQILPLPRHYVDQGLRRYGFHGLSYSFVINELRRQAGEEAANGRLILAHLGNGVSLAAVYQGKSLDTTMGLTPAGGVPMSTRSGDLDPGIFAYLARSERLDAAGFDTMVNFQSGLLGISGISSDMKELLEREPNDERAAEAITVFCYQIKKSIGALAATLGGLDQLVFTGGMGEEAPRIRARICTGLEFLGLVMDESRNQTGEALISTDQSRVAVRVVYTDEAQVIAQETAAVLQSSSIERSR